MPTYLQGDIFKASGALNAELAIVFGHIGFNPMAVCWRDNSQSHPRLGNIQDPFTEIPNLPIRVAPDRWLWFVPAGENIGLTDLELATALDAALRWAELNGLRTIMTNGIREPDHGLDTEKNRLSDDARAHYLIDYASKYEANHEITIMLTSLNDVFVRNAPSEDDILIYTDCMAAEFHK